MRLLSLTVHHYRLHRDLTIEFDPSRTLIGGPNESGKSTLAEAIHRALFMRHKSGGELRKSMVSDTHGGHPRVILTFEADGDTWTIDKEFTGTAKATARLSSAKGLTFHGDAAEEKLAALAGNPDGTANTVNQITTRWAHLWVWQGTAGTDASTHTAGHRHALIQRLQETGLAAVMQSETDDLTRRKITTLHESLFTKTGSVKAGSPLDLATRALQEADHQLQAATDAQDRLQAAATEQESATTELAASEAALPGIRHERDTAQAALAQARDLSTRLENQQLVHSQAATVLKERTEADQRIREAIARADAAQLALAPAESHLQSLTEQTAAAAAAAAIARATAESAAAAVRTARQHHDLARAWLTRFEKAAALETLTARATAVTDLEKSLADDREALSNLPVITPAQLQTLHDLESRHAQARSALEAIATGIELISSPQSVTLDGQPLSPGTSRIITETAELTLADGTRLRIHPGGGTSLESTRQTAASLQLEIHSLLSQLAIANAPEAAAVVARRQELDQKIAHTQARLKDLGARDLPDALASATAAVAAATHEVGQRLTTLPEAESTPAPATSVEAETRLSRCRESLVAAEHQEHAQRQAAEATAHAHQQLAAALQSASEAITARRKEIDDHRAAARTLESIHGDAAARAHAIAAARDTESAAQNAVDTTVAALSSLRPESLETEIARLDRVIAIELNRQKDAHARLASARTTLATNGTTDPEADRLRALARFDHARHEHDREKRHAEAIDLLHSLFSQAQQSISRNITQPIADRITGYLECLFGHGVRIDVDWTDPAKPHALSITRPGTPTFPFDALSGGAREQVAAAVRLATAEILAASHHGCLPILFDDSFAYSDDERIRALQSMLDLAATRGLQVIVLSCTPASYIGFGARDIRLAPPQPGSPHRMPSAGTSTELTGPTAGTATPNPAR